MINPENTTSHLIGLRTDVDPVSGHLDDYRILDVYKGVAVVDGLIPEETGRTFTECCEIYLIIDKFATIW